MSRFHSGGGVHSAGGSVRDPRPPHVGGGRPLRASCEPIPQSDWSLHTVPSPAPKPLPPHTHIHTNTIHTLSLQACMLTFYPEFEVDEISDNEIIFLLDLSNSMKAST